MATPRTLSLSRTLTSFLLSRSYSCVPSSCPAATSLSLLRLRLRRLDSTGFHRKSMATATSGSLRRFLATRQQSMNDNNNSPTNWSNRPPKETILRDEGCDLEHWLVVTERPPEGATRDEIIDSYIKTLAQVVGSEEEARMKIYSVSTRHYFAFGALVPEELSSKLTELPNVRWVLPDQYLDVKNKDYGGEPFINGQAVPYDPKYHEEWLFNKEVSKGDCRFQRPRNKVRSWNFERRQRNPGFQNNPGGGGPGPNYCGPSNMGPGGPPNMPPFNNAGYQPNNPGFAQNMPPNNHPGFAPNSPEFAPNKPPNIPGFAHNPNHISGPPPPNRGGGMPPLNHGGGQANAGYPNNSGCIS